MEGGCWCIQTYQERQTAVLEFIKKELHKRGYPPSIREIGKAVGLQSSSTVHGHLLRLEEKGYIRRDPLKPRTIEVMDNSSDLLDVSDVVHIPIGGRTFPLPANLLQQENNFMVKFQGESMIDAGILDGDFIIARPEKEARNGEMVVALIGHETMVQRVYKERTLFRLQPENASMEPIYSQDVTILGKVVGVFRTIL